MSVCPSPDPLLSKLCFIHWHHSLVKKLNDFQCRQNNVPIPRLNLKTLHYSFPNPHPSLSYLLKISHHPTSPPSRLGYLFTIFQNTTSLHTWHPVPQRALPFLSLLPPGPHVHRGNTAKQSCSDVPVMIPWAFFFFFRYILYILPKLTPVSFLFI